MKRLTALLAALFLSVSVLYPISSEEESELREIFLALETENKNQQNILTEQEKTIELQQNKIDSLELVLSEQKNLSKEEKKSSVYKTTTFTLLAFIAGMFLGGYYGR